MEPSVSFETKHLNATGVQPDAALMVNQNQCPHQRRLSVQNSEKASVQPKAIRLRPIRAGTIRVGIINAAIHSSANFHNNKRGAGMKQWQSQGFCQTLETRIVIQV